MKTTLNLLPFLIAAGLLAYSHLRSPFTSAPLLSCEVVPNSIHDGDTLRADCDGQILKTRFACIDAPELKQPFGEASRDYLRSLINESQNKIQLKIANTDRYGRTIAELYYFSNGQWQSVQEAQAKAGTVWAYEKFKRSCPATWNAIATAEQAARNKQLGLWANSRAIAPWDWRQAKRS